MRFKARVVAGGNTQVPGRDVYVVYAPVVYVFYDRSASGDCINFVQVVHKSYSLYDSFLERIYGQNIVKKGQQGNQNRCLGNT